MDEWIDWIKKKKRTVENHAPTNIIYRGITKEFAAMKAKSPRL